MGWCLPEKPTKPPKGRFLGPKWHCMFRSSSQIGAIPSDDDMEGLPEFV